MHAKRTRRRRPPGAFAVAALLAFVSLGCGISLEAQSRQSEIFEHLEIEGDFAAEGALTLTFAYTNQYPVAIAVDCLLLEEDGETVVQKIAINSRDGGVALPFELRSLPSYADDAGAEATPISGTLGGIFSAPEQPGDYIVRCFTDQVETNKIEQRITIGPAVTPTTSS